MALCMLVALLLGIVQDAASRADAGHTHFVCPEHGEQLHADSSIAPEAERRTTEIRNLAAQEHGICCALAMFANSQAAQLLPAPSSIDVVVEWVELPTPIGSEPGTASHRNRLEFAPKTSPPQA